MLLNRGVGGLIMAGKEKPSVVNIICNTIIVATIIVGIVGIKQMAVKHNKIVTELKGLNDKVITGKYAQEISLIDDYKDIKVFFEHDGHKDLLSEKEVTLASVLDVHPVVIYDRMFDVNVEEDGDNVTVLIKKHTMSKVEEVTNNYGDPVYTFPPDVISEFQEALSNYKLPEETRLTGATSAETSWTVAFKFGKGTGYATIDKDTKAIIDSGVIVDGKPVSFEIQD